jgi:hypothetical protein
MGCVHVTSLVLWLGALEPGVVAAIVSLVVTVLTLAVSTFVAPRIKFSFDERLEAQKLELAYRSEQIKALKDHLARHRGRFLEAGDDLSHRLWNYEQNQAKGWLKLNGQYAGTVPYYALSFAYRLLACLAAARRMEREAFYVDATVAAEEDFAFLKALKLGNQVWTSTTLFDGLDYDSAIAADHFFGDRLTSMAEQLDSAEPTMSLKRFESAVAEEEHPFVDMFRFFDGLCAGEDRYRHDRAICAHLVLIATLNRFGYDFQTTEVEEIIQVISTAKNPEVLANLKVLVERVKLDKDPEFSRLIGLLPST